MHPLKQHLLKQHLLTAALLCASIGATAQALPAEPPQAPYPDNALRCVVVAGSSVRYADPKVQQLAATLNRSITNFVNEEFNARHYESSPVFREPDATEPDPPRWLVQMVRRRCGHLVQIVYEASEDSAGSYFAWEVQVMHLDRKASPDPRATLVTVGDYRKRYRYDRTPQFLDRFIMSDFAHTVVEDVMASGTLPGLHAIGTVTDADVRALYERLVAATPRTEYATRHILAPTEAAAQAALDRLRGGEPFAGVAQALSQDPGSKDKGGDLGWAPATAYTPEFAAAMRALAPQGRTAAPVKSRFGWHVIEVTDARPVPVPDFDGQRERLRALLVERDRKRETATP